MPEIAATSLYSDANLQGYWRLNQTEDTNTKLLLHFNGADAATSTLEATGKAVTFAGNAQIDTAQKVFGSASLLLDGTGDYLTLADSADWSLGTGDWTFDCWWRTTDTAVDQTFFSQYTDGNNRFYFGYTTTPSLILNVISGGSAVIQSNQSWTAQPNTWYHIAVVRTGNDFKIFVDGTQIGSTVTDTSGFPDYGNSFYIGTNWNGASGSAVKGWLDEVRWVKGAAKWTTTFTAPTVPYTYAGDDSSSNGYHVVPGTIPTFVAAKFGNGADFEAGSTQYLTIADASCPNLEISGSQTWCLWVKPETLTDYQCPAAKCATAGTTDHSIFYSSTGAVYFRLTGLTTNTTVISSNTISAGVWNFVAGVYNSSTSKLRVFVNGTWTEVTASGSANDTNAVFSIGRQGATTNYCDGVVDDVAIWNRALTDAEVLSIYNSFKPIVMMVD